MNINNVVHGDCLDALREIDPESIDLIYLDPPFYTQKKHTLSSRDNQKYSFDDSWTSVDQYLQFMKEVVIKCREKLKYSGSIILHCDKNANHHLRILLDNVFGSEMFVNEIIWNYKRWTNSRKGLMGSHQNLYFYSKTKDFKFNTLYIDYSPTTNIDQILQKRERSGGGKSCYKRDQEGNIIQGDGKKGVPLGDVWDIPYLNPKATERVGYPTQKPVLLLERIIELATDVDDIVLDPFCGSGTTLVASKLLNRKFIGIDISIEAVRLSNERVENPIKTTSNLLLNGSSSYSNKDTNELDILEALNAVPVQRNSGIDGFLKEKFNCSYVAVKIQKDNETLNQALGALKRAGKKKECKYMILVAKDNSSLIDVNEKNILIIKTYGFAARSWLSGLI